MGGAIINLASLGSVPGVIRPYETETYTATYTISGSSGGTAFISNVGSVTGSTYGQTNNVSDTAIQLTGAKGYSKDIILEWIYRYARQAKLVDGASEVHQKIINRIINNYKANFWHWGIGHDS